MNNVPGLNKLSVEDRDKIGENEKAVREYLVSRFEELNEGQSFTSYYDYLVREEGSRYVDQHLIPNLFRRFGFDINARLREERAKIFDKVNEAVQEILNEA